MAERTLTVELREGGLWPPASVAITGIIRDEKGSKRRNGQEENVEGEDKTSNEGQEREIRDPFKALSLSFMGKSDLVVFLI